MNKKESGVASLYFTMLSSLGYVIMLLGIIMLIPCICLFFYPEERHIAHDFILPGVMSILVGYLLRTITNGYASKNLNRNEGFLIVFLIWIASIFIGAFPFFLSGKYTFTQAVFESASGFTTTGMSITDLNNATHMLLLYRSTLHFFGGVGLILILTIVLSQVYGMQLFSAEGHKDALTPNLKNSARYIFFIYVGLIVTGTIAYIICGMGPFDAVNHAISAVATGGFSTKEESIGYYHNYGISAVSIVLMLAGATNFMSTLFLFKGKVKEFFFHCETRILFGLVIVTTPIVAALMYQEGAVPQFGKALAEALFQVVSILTTTGFVTMSADWLNAGLSSVPLLLLLMIGGNSGSTAGGIKSYRVGFIFKQIRWTFQDMISTNRVHHPRHIIQYGKRVPVSKQETDQINTYILLYIGTCLLGVFGLTCYGYAFRDALMECFSIIGTVGVSVGVVSPHMETGAYWICVVLMLVGRLEVYVIPMALYRAGSDLKDLFSVGEKRYERHQRRIENKKRKEAQKNAKYNQSKN